MGSDVDPSPIDGPTPSNPSPIDPSNVRSDTPTNGQLAGSLVGMAPPLDNASAAERIMASPAYQALADEDRPFLAGQVAWSKTRVRTDGEEIQLKSRFSDFSDGLGLRTVPYARSGSVLRLSANGYGHRVTGEGQFNGFPSEVRLQSADYHGNFPKQARPDLHFRYPVRSSDVLASLGRAVFKALFGRYSKNRPPGVAGWQTVTIGSRWVLYLLPNFPYTLPEAHRNRIALAIKKELEAKDTLEFCYGVVGVREFKDLALHIRFPGCPESICTFDGPPGFYRSFFFYDCPLAEKYHNGKKKLDKNDDDESDGGCPESICSLTPADDLRRPTRIFGRWL